MFCSASDDNTVKVTFLIHLKFIFVLFENTYFEKLWDRRKKNEAMSFDSEYQVLAVAFNENADQSNSSFSIQINSIYIIILKNSYIWWN